MMATRIRNGELILFVGNGPTFTGGAIDESKCFVSPRKTIGNVPLRRSQLIEEGE